MVLAQFDGANGDDFVVNALGSAYNNSYVGLFTPTSDSTGTLYYPPYLGFGSSGWDVYRMRVGDIDGTSGADLVWVRSTASTDINGVIHRALNNGNGTFTIQSYQEAALKTGPLEPFLADFNNDGRDDILLNHRSASVNELIVGFGTASGKFTFPAGIQTHPATPAVGWEPYDQVFVGDVNGDGKADIVWTNPSSEAHVYVALSK